MENGLAAGFHVIQSAGLRERKVIDQFGHRPNLISMIGHLPPQYRMGICSASY